MKKYLTILLALGLFSITAEDLYANNRPVPIISDPKDVYTNKIKPIFEKRCVVCHACYDSPCNLVLTSYDGLTRGGHNYDPYGTNVKGIDKQRLGKDAKTVAQWRANGFHEVVDQNPASSASEKIEKSLLIKFVQLGAKNNKPGNILQRKPPKNKECVRSAEEFDGLFKKSFFSYLNPFSLSKKEKIRKNSALGMPFGLPPLDEKQISSLTSWVEAGSPGPTKTTEEAAGKVSNPVYIKIAERFLNRGHLFPGSDEKKGRKYRWTAKYLYEHLYMAHLHHEENPGEFFELVRSSTKKGPIKEIVTEFSYDNPGREFWYRLKKVTQTIVYKNHIVYSLSNENFKRINELFIDIPWPDEESEGGAGIPEVNWDNPNPFVNFAPIPAKIRYQWLIENSKVMVDLFTRGPVCNGGTATYAVRDYFWVMFMDPDSDISLNIPGFFNMKSGSRNKNGKLTMAELLMVPPLNPNEYEQPFFYTKRQYEYEKFHAKMLAQSFPEGLSEADIWNGEYKEKYYETSNNQNALLTVYRHDLSVSVHLGRMGNVPKTAWVLDYPTFERIYYNLVAGFDVYGSLLHKLRTRIYMERLRREAEDNFIVFLPEEMRIPVRESWYKKDKQKPDKKEFYPFDVKSKVERKYSGRMPAILGGIQPKDLGEGGYEKAGRQFMRRMVDLVFSKGTSGYPDTLNDHHFAGTTFKGELPETFEGKDLNRGRDWMELLSLLTRLADVKKPFVKFFKDVSYLALTQEEGKKTIYFTIIANKSHKSMNVIFAEKQTRDPENDTLHFVPDLVISYPNQFYEVPLAELPKFITMVEAMKKEEDYKAFEEIYGIQKSNEKFWTYFDDLQKNIWDKYPVFGGIIDFNRYGTHNFTE
ncbi:MAG: fatty acid cis/trans isomerase [Deltaproteobacteria bacterium]|nr:fatty acid cis/trans isomerase [Deltaproteobacteria bacterium]